MLEKILLRALEYQTVAKASENVLDYQPLFGKWARAPPPFFSGRDADQTREIGVNRAYVRFEVL